MGLVVNIGSMIERELAFFFFSMDEHRINVETKDRARQMNATKGIVRRGSGQIGLTTM